MPRNSLRSRRLCERIPGIPEQNLNTLADPFPRGIAAPPGSSRGLLTNIGQGAGFDNPDRKMPRILQFSFGLQRDLPGRMNLDVSYVGSRTHNYSPARTSTTFLSGRSSRAWRTRGICRDRS